MWRKIFFKHQQQTNSEQSPINSLQDGIDLSEKAKSENQSESDNYERYDGFADRVPYRNYRGRYIPKYF
jgi:hypothetical protein